MTRYKLSEAEFKLWKCPEDERVVDEPRQVSSSRRGSWIVVNTEPINPKSDPPEVEGDPVVSSVEEDESVEATEETISTLRTKGRPIIWS